MIAGIGEENYREVKDLVDSLKENKGNCKKLIEIINEYGREIKEGLYLFVLTSGIESGEEKRYNAICTTSVKDIEKVVLDA